LLAIADRCLSSLSSSFSCLGAPTPRRRRCQGRRCPCIDSRRLCSELHGSTEREHIRLGSAQAPHPSAWEEKPARVPMRGGADQARPTMEEVVVFTADVGSIPHRLAWLSSASVTVGGWCRTAVIRAPWRLAAGAPARRRRTCVG
jgi:hypothetical protein